jgi:uncharacterized protein with PIN domain
MLKSTPEMRNRARELAQPIRDDFDRAVLAILDDFAELEKQVYVSGLWRCPKCEFQLCQATLYAATGTVGARDTPGDKCPNCNGPLWRVSERQAGNEMVKRCEEELERNRMLNAVIEKQALALMKIRTGAANPVQIAKEAMNASDAL